MSTGLHHLHACGMFLSSTPSVSSPEQCTETPLQTTDPPPSPHAPPREEGRERWQPWQPHHPSTPGTLIPAVLGSPGEPGAWERRLRKQRHNLAKIRATSQELHQGFSWVGRKNVKSRGGTELMPHEIRESGKGQLRSVCASTRCGTASGTMPGWNHTASYVPVVTFCSAPPMSHPSASRMVPGDGHQAITAAR